MKKIQKSMSFLTYTLNIPSNHLWKGLVSTYTGNYDVSADDSWGEYLFLMYDENKVDEDQLSVIRKNRYYVDEYSPEPNRLMFQMKIPTKYKKSVVTPFLQGRYSEMDKEYINTFFNPTSGIGGYSTNYLILTKDKSLRKFWEDQIGIPLPHNAEVWSRPRKEDEVYNYDDYIVKREVMEIPLESTL